MGNLIQSAIEMAAAQDSAQRVENLNAYRELLLRNKSPHSGDEARLIRVMGALGRTPADLAADLGLAERISECEALAPKVEAFRLELREKKMLLTAAREWVEQARAQLEKDGEARVAPARVAEAEALAKLSAADVARDELPRLQKQWASLGAYSGS